jgi:hypothetical protein
MQLRTLRFMDKSQEKTMRGRGGKAGMRGGPTTEEDSGEHRETRRSSGLYRLRRTSGERRRHKPKSTALRALSKTQGKSKQGLLQGHRRWTESSSGGRKSRSEQGSSLKAGDGEPWSRRPEAEGSTITVQGHRASHRWCTNCNLQASWPALSLFKMNVHHAEDTSAN